MSAPTITLSIPELDDDVDMLTAALAYAACGWYVLPVKHGTKNPGSIVGKHWQDKSSRDPQQIAAWFAGTDHDIALHCGRSGTLVFDADDPAKLPEILCKHLDTAPYQPTRPDTPGRGHYVFLQPIGRTIGNGWGRLGRGWGEVRGLNAVIIAAPSSHKDCGRYGPWQRTGPVPALPDEITEQLDDASPAEDAATDTAVVSFLAEHTAATRPEVLAGLVSTLEDQYAAGASRHLSTLSVTAGVMKEARLGLYPAQVAVDTIRPMFLTEVAKEPVSDRQGAARNGKVAASEFDGILSWAIGQANGADLDKVRDRVNEKMPDNVEEVDADTITGNGKADSAGMPRVWWVNDLKPAVQPRWLAKNRIPRGAVSLLIGDEGIGKSLLWVLIVAAVTIGKAMLEFGIPARAPGHVLIAAITEDDWQTVVLPRLIVAGADLDMIRVICTDDDGSGAPIFPRDMFLITGADPKPDLVVVDAWLDTVPAGLQVRDTQQARQALHPWKEAATILDAALLVLCHTNRVDSANARDRYGATIALRQKARMTLFAQQNEEGQLVVGPEKANGAAATTATLFTIGTVQHFEPTDDHDGTVPLLAVLCESTQTAREHLTDTYNAAKNTSGGSDVIGWVAVFLAAGPRWATDVYTAAEAAGYSKKKAWRAKVELNVRTDRIGGNGPWYWALPQHPDSTPHSTPPPSVWNVESGNLGHNPHSLSTSQDSLMTNGERWENGVESGKTDSDFTQPRFTPPTGPGRCLICGWHVETQGHAPHCQQTAERTP